MCITFFCCEPASNTRIKLILGFNRDEQTQRETLALGSFKEDKNIYAGRDIISNGTWLGVNIETGLLVILTNFDYEKPRFGLSRGQLVESFLETKFIPEGRRSETDEIVEKRMC